jgi:hypothetical protein
MELLGSLLRIFGSLAVILFSIRVTLHGMPVMRGRYRAWRIRQSYQATLVDRALLIQAEHPEIPYQCVNWPKWTILCGQCCAVSRAHFELRDERDRASKLLQYSDRQSAG